jgi:hypothetical protein
LLPAKLFPRLVCIFRELRPAIVHSRNLAALEVTVPAWLARVPARIHGEHGRDVGDLDGANKTHPWVRRDYNLFVSRWTALSRDLESYLTGRVGCFRWLKASRTPSSTRWSGPTGVFTIVALALTG